MKSNTGNYDGLFGAPVLYILIFLVISIFAKNDTTLTTSMTPSNFTTTMPQMNEMSTQITIMRVTATSTSTIRTHITSIENALTGLTTAADVNTIIGSTLTPTTKSINNTTAVITATGAQTGGSTLNSTTGSTLKPTTKSSPDSPVPVAIIIGAVAVIIVIIVCLTAICLCYITSSGNRRRRKEPPLNDHLENDTKIDNQTSNKSTDQLHKKDEDLEKGGSNSVGNNIYDRKIHETLKDDKSLSLPARSSLKGNLDRDKRMSSPSGNIFDKVDPTAENYQEIELSPALYENSNQDNVFKEDQRDKLTPPEPVLRSTSQERPRPQPRARNSYVTPDVIQVPSFRTENETELKDVQPSEDLIQPPSPTTPTEYPEKARKFRIPLKGKGPDGSDQAALLANVLIKSNAAGRLSDSGPNSDATTYY